MKKDSAVSWGSLASILIAMILIAMILLAMILTASCERESAANSASTSEPRSEGLAPSPELMKAEGDAPLSKAPHLRLVHLTQNAAGGNLFVQDEFSKLVANYAEDSGLSLGESCLRLYEEIGRDLKPEDRDVLLTLLHRALIGDYKEQNILALGLAPGMPRTKLIAGHLSSLRSDLAIDEMMALHDGLGPGRDRKAAAVKLALTTMDRDGLGAAAEWASELDLPEEREEALVGLAHDFVLQGLDRESDEHLAGYERLMELAQAAGESVHRRVRGPFLSAPIEVISPEELERRKKLLNIPE